MIKIAVCDNSDFDLNLMDTYLSNFFSLEYEVDLFVDGEDLLRYSEQNQATYNIYFLDIEMPIFTGIEVAKLIRGTDLNAIIVFFTSHTEYMQDVFEVQTFDYLVKPLGDKAVRKCFDRIENFLKTSQNYFEFSENRMTYIVDSNNILFFEKQRRKVTIHTLEGAYQSNMNTSQILDQLDKQRFARIHSGYIINLNYVAGIKGNEVIMKQFSEGTLLSTHGLLPISRKYKHEFREAYFTFFRKRL